MAKEQTWQVNIDGTEHTVTFIRQGLRSSASTLFVDEGEGKLIWPRDGYVDEEIMIGDKACRFVVRNYIPDIVVDGMLVDGKKPYVHIEDVPAWCRYLTVILIVILLLLLRNAWVAIIAGGVAWLVTDRIAHAPGMTRKKKITYYLAVLAAVLIVSLIFAIVRSNV